MQDEDQELNKLSPETIQRAIDAVKARAWDINPFTVADELKISRSVVYRHAEIMKLIIAARGGSFGMDVQTSLDLAWQLRQLEQQNNELKEKLAISGSHKNYESLSREQELANLVPVKNSKTDDAEEVIFNLAKNGPEMSSYLNQLAELRWKDIETVYYLRVSSLREYAQKVFSVNTISQPENGDNAAYTLDNKGAISYSSLASLEEKNRNKQVSISPFAQLKSTSLGTSNAKREINSSPLFFTGRGREDDISLPIETLIEPEFITKESELVTGENEFVNKEPGQQNNKFANEISKVVADLHRDLASKIRSGLAAEGKESASQLPVTDNNVPVFSGWLSLGKPKSSRESASSLNFEQAKPVIETENTMKFEPQMEYQIEAEIKLIPLLKDSPFTQESSIVSKKNEIETGEMEITLVQADKANASSSMNTETISVEDDKANASGSMNIETVSVEDDKKDSFSLVDNKTIFAEDDKKDYSNVVETEIISTKSDNKDASDSADELRDLIQSHIRNAAEQMAEFSHGHSIGSGKEFEVWLNNPARSKFVGSTKATEPSTGEEPDLKNQAKNSPFKPRVVPPDVRKSCLILGLRPDNITYEVVQESWKKAIAAPGVHPDHGGDTEMAVYLNTAKDVLLRFLDAQAPKLGKKFGPYKVEKDVKPKADKPRTDKPPDTQ